MPQHIGILAVQPLTPSFHQSLERLYLCHRTACQLQPEDDGLLDDLPQADTMQLGRCRYLSHRGVADASCRVVDDAPQGFFIVRISHHAEVGNDILNLLALVE